MVSGLEDSRRISSRHCKWHLTRSQSFLVNSFFSCVRVSDEPRTSAKLSQSGKTWEVGVSVKRRLRQIVLDWVWVRPHPPSLPAMSPQWGAADAEIKVPSGENTELKRSPFKAWSTSVYSHTCYAYCQGFHSCLNLHFRSIQLHFFQNLSRFFPVLAVANTWFLCRPAE